MIIRPAQKNLKNTMEDIGKSDHFGFVIEPTPGHRGKGVAYVDSIDMYGPWRDYAWKTKSPESYNDAIWYSEINVYPVEPSDWHICESFTKAAGLPTTQRIRKHEVSMRYDFPPELQPERNDNEKVIPHIIYFNLKLKPPVIKGIMNEFETGNIDRYIDRILYPAPKGLTYKHTITEQLGIDDQLCF